jgi:hypothetical protein
MEIEVLKHNNEVIRIAQGNVVWLATQRRSVTVDVAVEVRVAVAVVIAVRVSVTVVGQISTNAWCVVVVHCVGTDTVVMVAALAVRADARRANSAGEYMAQGQNELGSAGSTAEYDSL